jgi:predicted metal-dependent hydrolase
MEELFWRGVEEFNARRFFEAHDIWEELWRETSGTHRLFYQGLIQTAVGFYHFSGGNLQGACSQFRKSLQKLERYLSAYNGIDTQHLVDHVRVCLQNADALRNGSPGEFNTRMIPQIRLHQ